MRSARRAGRPCRRISKRVSLALSATVRNGRSARRTDLARGSAGSGRACKADPMEYATEKWGGRPHYRGLVHVLGDDEHGTWLWGPAGRTIFRGDVPLFLTQQDALILLLPDTWWSPGWWIGHPETEVYVNIGTPPEWEDTRVSSTDLDLDVVRFCDGRLEIVDEDEFELHQHVF